MTTPTQVAEKIRPITKNQLFAATRKHFGLKSHLSLWSKSEKAIQTIGKFTTNTALNSALPTRKKTS